MPATNTHSRTSEWKPLVVCPHQAMSQRLLAVLRELLETATPVSEYPRMGQMLATAQQTGCDICFLDVATNPEHAQQLISELSPVMPVVALHTRAEADLILRCLRRGACEFLTEPTADALRNLFARLGRSRSPSAERPAGTVLAVVPGKGGSGASTVAAHLAICLAATGSSVLLVDGDSLHSSISFILNLKTEFHMGDVLRDWRRMDADLWQRFTVRSSGVDILAAPTNPTARIEMNPQVAAELCSFWRERYEYILLDLADARAAADMGFAGLADSLLLVVANELGALQATRRAVECLDKPMEGRKRIRLILNRTTGVSGLKREDVLGALGVEPYAVIGDEWAVLQAALLDGQPVPASSKFAAGIEALCRQLRTRPATEEHTNGEKKNGSWLSLLRHRNKAESGK